MLVAERKVVVEKNANIKKIGNKFTTQMPTPFDNASLLNVGDVLHIPTEFEVYEQSFPNFKRLDGTIPSNQFIICPVTRVNGNEDSVQFKPLDMLRPVFPAKKEDGEVMGTGEVLHQLGSAADKFRSFLGQGTDDKSDVAIAMEFFAGKDILIKDKKPIQVQAWDNGERANKLTNGWQFTYELVG